jgi:glycerophosphoryl diester phosphodiesterase
MKNLLLRSLLLSLYLPQVQVFSLTLRDALVQDQDPEESPRCIPPPLVVPSTVTTHAPQIVIAHRGASAHLPEHTLPAYRLALELGADYVEPDLVPTKDNQLIAIHSMDLNVTTDVAEKFPSRQIFSKYLNRTGYWTYEFTLTEIKTLRVHQRLPAARSTAFDGKYCTYCTT